MTEPKDLYSCLAKTAERDPEETAYVTGDKGRAVLTTNGFATP